LSELIAEHTDLSLIQSEAAAKFIGDCLRLNPFSRLTVDQLELHQWLETAFMSGADKQTPGL
jgi:serine/threonine-protein kinase SRPK3